MMNENAPFCRIPVIDLARSSASDVRTARDVRAAGRDLGMFYVVNHGVPTSLITAHFDFARAFFALDLSEKRAIDVSRSNCFRGYQGFGTQTIDLTAPGDAKEGFIMGPDFPPDHPSVLARYPNTGTNLWPERPIGFRHHMEAYVDAINGLGRRLASIIALSLELPADYFSAPLAEPLTYSQLLLYPSLPAHESEHRLGAGAHVDWGMLTILLQDDVGGLEVAAPDAVWHPVPPQPDAFLIIMGEMMLRLTNGLYRSAHHRVVKNTSGRSRYSMPTFFDPAYDHLVACVPTCAPRGGAPTFPACTVGEHMLAMAQATLSSTHGGAAQ